MTLVGSQQSSPISFNSLSSAEVVVPLVLEFVQARSVVDFGCKHGEWLSVFRNHGATTLLGFDQPKRISQGLLISSTEFRAADLRCPVSIDGRFDLAVCIEVAEHLPASAAELLISTLTNIAPVILFSAAIPGQGGHGHSNEQPREYWTDLFSARGFVCIDCLRGRIWQDADVAWWYRQNLLMYCREDALAEYPALDKEFRRRRAGDLEAIHVDILARRSLWSKAKAVLRAV